MGMYTGFKINVKLKSTLPDDILYFIKIIAGTVDKTTKYYEHSDNPDIKLLDHDFFRCHRWHAVMGNYGGVQEYECDRIERSERLLKNDDGTFTLKNSGSFKNYQDEIDLFLNWLLPYVDESEYGKIVGKYRYEEDDYGLDTKFGFNKDLVTINDPYS